MRGILSPAPLDLVDLLFYLEGLQVIEFWFVGLKFGMEFVLAGFFLNHVSSSVPIDATSYCVQSCAYRLVPLEQHNSSAFVSSC
jgi:hypothetical protein